MLLIASARAEMKSNGIPIVSDAELQAMPEITRVPNDLPHHKNMFLRNDSLDPNLSRNAMFLQQCPYCYQPETKTRIKTFPTWETYTLSGILLFLCLPICWVPLVIDNCQQTDHFCSQCDNQVGSVPAFHDCCVTRRGYT